MKLASLTVAIALLAVVLLGTYALAVPTPPPGAPAPPGSHYLPAGHHVTHFDPQNQPPPPPPGVPDPSTIDVGYGLRPVLINGRPATLPTPPPECYEDADGNLWYFYDDDTFLMLSTVNGQWYGGTYT